MFNNTNDYNEKKKKYLIDKYASFLVPAFICALVSRGDNGQVVEVIFALITIVSMIMHVRRWKEHGVYAAFIYEHETGETAPKGWYIKRSMKEGFQVNKHIFASLMSFVFGGFFKTVSKEEMDRRNAEASEKEEQERRERDRMEAEAYREAYKDWGTGA